MAITSLEPVAVPAAPPSPAQVRARAQATLLLLIGIAIYAFLKARRERLGEVSEPVELVVR